MFETSVAVPGMCAIGRAPVPAARSLLRHGTGMAFP